MKETRPKMPFGRHKFYGKLFIVSVLNFGRATEGRVIQSNHSAAAQIDWCLTATMRHLSFTEFH